LEEQCDEKETGKNGENMKEWGKGKG